MPMPQGGFDLLAASSRGLIGNAGTSAIAPFPSTTIGWPLLRSTHLKGMSSEPKLRIKHFSTLILALLLAAISMPEYECSNECERNSHFDPSPCAYCSVIFAVFACGGSFEFLRRIAFALRRQLERMAKFEHDMEACGSDNWLALNGGVNFYHSRVGRAADGLLSRVSVAIVGEFRGTYRGQFDGKLTRHLLNCYVNKTEIGRLGEHICISLARLLSGLGR